MRKTFLTTMESRAGAFLEAVDIISSQKGNITRVNYNKSVDEHTLFIDVEAEATVLEQITKKLEKAGFLSDGLTRANVILMEFKLKDEAGTLAPLLKIIQKYNINITYINSEENTTGYQYFKMGLFIDEPSIVKQFLDEAASYCPVRIIEYDPTEKILDNTVFYLSFASEIDEALHLTNDEKNALILESNRIMQMLDEKNEPPYKTFEAIADYADMIAKAKGNGFNPRVSVKKLDNGVTLTLIEPDCGSNSYIFSKNNKLLFIDSGFECYKEEMCALLRGMFPGFDSLYKELMLTHSDTDHCGLMHIFDKVYMSKTAFDDFTLRIEGKACLREQNPAHAPYSRISDILTKRSIPNLSTVVVIGGENEQNTEMLDIIGCVCFEGLDFTVRLGAGGHLPGEIVLYNQKYRLYFTGDIFVNIKGYTPAQARFNQIAPFLMTNVDTNSALGSVCRKKLLELIGEERCTICGGHGYFYEYPIKK